jgi:hypothetical protein
MCRIYRTISVRERLHELDDLILLVVAEPQVADTLFKVLCHFRNWPAGFSHSLAVVGSSALREHIPRIVEVNDFFRAFHKSIVKMIRPRHPSRQWTLAGQRASAPRQSDTLFEH